MTGTFTSRSASTLMVARTAAAPDMSVFMVFIESGGLSDSPPESKVMPLPTRTTSPVAPLGA